MHTVAVASNNDVYFKSRLGKPNSKLPPLPPQRKRHVLRSRVYNLVVTGRDSVSRDCGEDQFIENKDKVKNPKQSLRFCTAEESRLNKSLELQMAKDLRRENEEEGRRLDPRGWEGGTWAQAQMAKDLRSGRKVRR